MTGDMLIEILQYVQLF